MMDASSSDSEISLAKKCLELCSTLTDKDSNFSFQLRLGSGFNFSLKSEKVAKPKAKTRRSPSFLNRQHRRHQEFLKKKSESTDGAVAEKRHGQQDKGETTAVPNSCKSLPCPKPSSQPPPRPPPPPPPPPPPLPPSSSRLVRFIRRSDGPRVSFQQLDGGGEREVKGGDDAGEGLTAPGEVNDQVLTDTEADFEGTQSEFSDMESSIDWGEIDRLYYERSLPGQSFDDFLVDMARDGDEKLNKWLADATNKYLSDEDCESDY